MNIKSLLLGSAAVLVAATGAKAADAIVIPEPEPVEYVRVCDAYGAGFFYIPGTETCLSISGYVWYQIGAGSYDSTFDTYGYHDSNLNDGWMKTTRTRLNFDARSDTEWGTLRAFIRLQANWGTPSDGPVAVDQGYIQLGGLMMGYSESFWADSKNGGPSNYGSHTWGGLYYGYQQRHLVGYRFNGSNGFFAAVALEDDTLSGDGYMPDLVGKIGVAQGWGAVWARAAYDESFDDIVGVDGGFAGQLGLQYNISSMPGTSIRVLAFYADGDHAYNVGAPSCDPLRCATGGAEWSILGSLNYQINPTLGIQLGAQYFSDLYLAGTDVSTGTDAWAAEVGFVWMPVENFEVRTEVVYTDRGEFNGVAGGFDPEGTVSGYLRFTRYF